MRVRLLLLVLIGAIGYFIYDLMGGGMQSGPGSGNAVIDAFANAIATAEGFGIAGAIPTNANNPGDLTEAGQGYAGDTGQTIGAGIIVFDSVQDGWNALYQQLNLIFSGGSGVYNTSMTIAQFGNLWSGGDQNWINNVSSFLGVPSSTPIGQVSA